MLQAAALAFSTGAKQEGTHARGKTNTDSVYIRLDVLHGVKNSKPVVHRATWRIDIEEDLFFRVFPFKKQKLSNDSVG